MNKLSNAVKYQLLTTFFIALAVLHVHWGFSCLIVGLSIGVRWIIEETKEEEERTTARKVAGDEVLARARAARS